MADATDILSDVTGWIYFFAWSISFYPQIFLNYNRKRYHITPYYYYSTKGFSVEFATLNP